MSILSTLDTEAFFLKRRITLLLNKLKKKNEKISKLEQRGKYLESSIAYLKEDLRYRISYADSLESTICQLRARVEELEDDIVTRLAGENI